MHIVVEDIKEYGVLEFLQRLSCQLGHGDFRVDLGFDEAGLHLTLQVQVREKGRDKVVGDFPHLCTLGGLLQSFAVIVLHHLEVRVELLGVDVVDTVL